MLCTVVVGQGFVYASDFRLECSESSGDILNNLDVLRHLELAMHFNQGINLHVSIKVLLVFISGKLLVNCFCSSISLKKNEVLNTWNFKE